VVLRVSEFVDHKHTFYSTCGVQQGDPLGPLYFCCGLASLVTKIQQLGPVYNKWYMDDGGIIGSVDVLTRVWDLLSTEGPPLGLHLNPAKCEWSWLDPGCTTPCPIRVGGAESDQISMVPTAEIQMLGVPLGSDEKAATYVEGKIFGKLRSMVNRLAEFDDLQSAFFLLRVSFSIVRATHFMRTTPLSKWQVQARKFDETIRSAAESILGAPFSDQCYKQACLTPRLGGLGLRRVEDHAALAFSASWHEARKTCEEKWALPGNVVAEYASQKTGSFRKDEEILNKLITEAPNQRERQRLQRLRCEHAGAWVTALPSTLDGKDTVMQPRNFQVSVFVRLGVPVLAEEISCSLCMQTIDVFGDHAACCTKNADLIHRHNRVRNLLDKICTEGALSPILEKGIPTNLVVVPAMSRSRSGAMAVVWPSMSLSRALSL
jgi:hypothetical protein